METGGFLIISLFSVLELLIGSTKHSFQKSKPMLALTGD